MKINVTATEKLSAAIKTAQGRASARTIDAEEIKSEVKRIEIALSRILNKKDWVGAVFNIDINAQSFPGAYNGTPESTHFTLERFASGWFVTDVSRKYTKTSRRNELKLTEDQKSKLADFIEQSL